MNSTVTLVDYDPEWPKMFRSNARRVKEALGKTALAVERVGSTSVPGLPAKPVIDMILVVADSSKEESYVPALESAGYVLRVREPEWYQHRLLKGPDKNVNLHVFSEGSQEIDRVIRFRDRLRTNREDRELYARTKKSLAKRKWKYMDDYAFAKSEVIKSVLSRT